MTTEIERRGFTVEGLLVEQRDGKPALIRGHAAVFNTLSEDLGGFREQIAPGAFAEAIGKDDVRALFNHDPNFILGRTVSRTLRLREDARGLAIEIDAPDTQTVRDLVLAPIERGDVSQMSFGFSIRPGGQDWAKDDEGRVIRTLKRVRLFDVSPVTFPAYPATDVALRELRAWVDAAGGDAEALAAAAAELAAGEARRLRMKMRTEAAEAA
jgi:HK97 family phage prohead protease